MSKILVVQPYRLLQYAFSTALFPEHQVEVTETIPEPSRINSADVVIVDAGALREHDSFYAQKVLAVENWKIPTIWIDSEKSSPAPARENLFVINNRLTKETLQKVLSECLKGTGAAKAPPKSSALVKISSSEQNSRNLNAGKNIIELLDVVEED